MPGSNPYDIDYGTQEARFIKALSNFEAAMAVIVQPSEHIGPSALPPRAAELKELITEMKQSAVAEREGRLVGDARSDLLRHFPRSGLVTEEGTEASLVEPNDDRVFDYLRAAYETYGELLGKL